MSSVITVARCVFFSSGKILPVIANPVLSGVVPYTITRYLTSTNKHISVSTFAFVVDM